MYSAAAGRDETQRGMVGDLLERAFQGSAGKLVMQALSNRRASKEEIEQIRKMLDEMSGEDE